MANFRDVYNLLCFDLSEDFQLRLGLITDAQMLSIGNDVVSDFCMKTCAVKRIYTQTSFAGQSLYTVPDDIERVDQAFFAGKWLGRETQSSLSNSRRNWRVDMDTTPTCFHEDGLPIKTVEIIPIPKNNGTYINGPLEPDPPHAIYDSFTAMGLNARNLRALTIIGPRKPDLMTTLDSDIPLLPDDVALAYIPFGILERICSADSELKELQVAAFCAAQYREGIALLAAVTGEVDEPQGQQQ